MHCGKWYFTWSVLLLFLRLDFAKVGVLLSLSASDELGDIHPDKGLFHWLETMIVISALR